MPLGGGPSCANTAPATTIAARMARVFKFLISFSFFRATLALSYNVILRLSYEEIVRIGAYGRVLRKITERGKGPDASGVVRFALRGNRP
jgi:hypothetical protein